MKIFVFLIIVIVSVAWADQSIQQLHNESEHLHQGIGADLSMKMLMMEDGSPKGKCYCSCRLNNQPVFMELDPSTLSASDIMMVQ